VYNISIFILLYFTSFYAHCCHMGTARPG